MIILIVCFWKIIVYIILWNIKGHPTTLADGWTDTVSQDVFVKCRLSQIYPDTPISFECRHIPGFIFQKGGARSFILFDILATDNTHDTTTNLCTDLSLTYTGSPLAEQLATSSFRVQYDLFDNLNLCGIHNRMYI